MAKIVCRECGAIVNIKHEFCTNCNASLSVKNPNLFFVLLEPKKDMGKTSVEILDYKTGEFIAELGVGEEIALSVRGYKNLQVQKTAFKIAKVSIKKDEIKKYKILLKNGFLSSKIKLIEEKV